MIQIIRSVVGGFLMGTADLVPGVSGGTVALVIGIYERLVASIREGSSALGSVLRGSFTGFKEHLGRVEWSFLLPLLAGILAAVVTLARILGDQLEERPTILAGLFFGLVLGSVVIAWRRLRQPTPVRVLVAVGVAAVLFISLGFGDGTAVGDPSLLALFGAGAVAICAMILPGISGSLILLLIGMYSAVLGSVNDRDLVALGIFLIGAIVGLGVFSQVLYWGLSRHHDLILAALVGLMAGSLRVLWPWPDGVDSAVLATPGNDWLGVGMASMVGFAAVFLIARLAADDEKVSAPLPAR